MASTTTQVPGGPCRVLVVADDLTGAAEIGGICRECGLTATILRSTGGNWAIDRPDADALILDTDSRAVAPDAARAVARRATDAALCHAGERGFEVIYKKVDSAMRGRVVDEIDGMLGSIGLSGALLIPQNPSLGRTIDPAGVYRIGGTPLASTAFAHDPTHPAGSSEVRHILARQGTRCVVTLAGLQDAVRRDGLTVATAESVTEVEAWAMRIPTTHLPVGGGDFFAAVLRSRRCCGATRPSRQPTPCDGTVLVVEGTASSRPPGVRELPAIAICPMPVDRSPEHWCDAVLRALRSGRRGVAMTLQGPLDRSPGAPQAIERAIAAAVMQVLAAWPEGIDRLLITGGATASAVCRHLGWGRFAVGEAWIRGVVNLLPTGSSVRITVKPGSYPWPRTVLAGLVG